MGTKRKEKLLWHAFVTKENGRSFWFWVEATTEKGAKKQVKKELYLPTEYNIERIHVERAQAHV